MTQSLLAQLKVETINEHLLNLICKDLAVLQELFICDPNQLFNIIKKINNLPKEVWNAKDNLQQSILAQVRCEINDRFKKITQWNFDHLELFNSILILNESFPINIQTLYKLNLLDKVENGIEYTLILEKLEKLALKSSIKEKAGNSQIKQYVNSLNENYKTTKNMQISQAAESTSIHQKRYFCLDHQQRVLYRLKLIHLIQNSHEATIAKDKSCLTNIDQQLQLLDAWIVENDKVQLFEELMKISCTLTKGYEKLIYDAKILLVEQAEQQENKIILQKAEKLKDKFITKKVLQTLLKRHEYAASALSLNNIAVINGKIYLKFGIANICQSTNMKQNGSVQWSSEKLKEVFQKTLTNFRLIMKAIINGESCHCYESGEFFQIPPERNIDLVLSCLQIMQKIKNMNQFEKFSIITTQLFNQPELFALFTQLIEFVEKQRSSKSPQIFVLVCDLLEYAKIATIQNVQILAEFTNYFISCLNQILENYKDIDIVPVLLCLLNIIAKIPHNGARLKQINLPKLYQAMFNGVVKKLQTKLPMDIFIDVFPDSYDYLTQQLQGQMIVEMNRLQYKQVTDKQKPDFLIYVFRKVYRKEKYLSGKMKQLIWTTFLKYPYQFFLYSIQIKKQVIKDVLNISAEDICLQFNNRYNQLMEITAQQNEETIQRQTIPLNKQIKHDINIFSSLLFLLDMQNLSFASDNMHQLVKLIISSYYYQSKIQAEIFKYEVKKSKEAKIKQDIIRFKLLQQISPFPDRLVLLSISTIKNISHDTSSFLKLCSHFLVALKDSNNKYFNYKLLILLQSIIKQRSKALKCHLGFQLYNYHQQLITQVFENMYSLVGIVVPTVSLQYLKISDTYGKIIKWCSQNYRNPIVQYDKMLTQTLRTSLTNMMKTIFVPNEGKCIFNNKLYTTCQDVRMVQDTVICNITTRVACNVDINTFQYCYDIVMNLKAANNQKMPIDEKQLNIEIKMPEQHIQIQSQQENKKQMIENYIAILSKVDKYKYNKQLLQRMQDMYIFILKLLKQNPGNQCREIMMIKDIIQQMKLYGEDIRANQPILVAQISWITRFQLQMGNYGLQNYVTAQFIIICVKLADILRQQQYQNQQQLNNLLLILVKLLPRTINEQYRSQSVAFTRRLIQVIIKIIQLQSYNYFHRSSLKPKQLEIKARNIQIIKNLIREIQKLKCSELNKQIHQLLVELAGRDQPIHDFLREIMDLQTHLASIEADIKGFFLKQFKREDVKHSSEITIPLYMFMSAFQDKYKNDAATFSSIVRKYLKMTTHNNDGKEKTYLTYDLSKSFTYSDILKKDFMSYQPSDEMKSIIKDLLNPSRIRGQAKRDCVTKYLKNLFLNYHILIPYVMLHPVLVYNEQTKKEQKMVSFMNFLLEARDTSMQNTNNLLIHSCLEYKYPIKTKKGDSFFSKLLCTKIIKCLLQEKAHQNNMIVISSLVSINRFAYLCRMKPNRKNQTSLLDYIIDTVDKLILEKQQDQRIVLEQKQYLRILQLIYKQVECKGIIKGLKPDKLPANIEYCGFSFQDIWLREEYTYKDQQEQYEDLILETKEDFYCFAYNFITPINSEENRQLFLEDIDEDIRINYEINFQNKAKINQFCLQSLSQRQFKALSLIIQSYILSNKDIQQSKPLEKPSLQNKIYVSRYSQPDANAQFVNKSEFQRQLTSVLETQKKIQNHHIPQGVFQDVLQKINEKLVYMNKQPIQLGQVHNLSQLQRANCLLNKQSEVDFDYNKFKLQPDDFNQYLLANSMKFERLKSKRKEQLQLTEEIMFTSHIARNFSTDSISYMIDTIDQNYQHLSTIERLKSDNYVLNQDNTNTKNVQFKIDESSMSDIVFPDVKEEVIAQLIFSFYFQNGQIRWQLLTFLENKKIQSRLITTLLCIAKDPFNSNLFPGYLSQRAQSFKTKIMKKYIITKTQEHKITLIKQILFALGLMKEYSYYRTDSFLSEEISNEGFFGTKYELEGQRDTFVPIYQIIILSIKYAIRVCPIFMKNVKGLPESVISQFNNFVTNNNWDEEEDQCDENEEILHDIMDPTDRCCPFACFQDIFSSQSFKNNFQEIYSLQEEPLHFLLPYLVQSNIYSPAELKKLQLKLLSQGDESDLSLMFINKAMYVYLLHQIREISWLQLYKEMIRKVFVFLIQKQFVVMNEPIYQLVKYDNELSSELKALLFKAELKQLVAQSRKQVNKIRCKKEKGIFGSAFEDLRYKPSNFWFQRFDVKFVDIKDREQSGHGNGVLREWFTLLSKAMVNLNYALFSRTPKNYYFFSRESYVNPRHLQYYEFIGKLFAFALTDDNLFISPSFSLLLYKLLLSQEITIEDVLLQFQEEAQYVRGLQQMIDNVKSNEDILAADLAFTYLDKRLISSANYSLLSDKQGKEAIGKKVELSCTKEEVIMELHSEEDKQTLPAATKVIKVTDIIELKPGGADIQVNIDNMHQYLALTKQKILELVVGSVKKQFQAFKQGFKQIINPKMLRRFNSKELKLLIEGMNEICIDDIQKYTNCKNVDSIVAGHLWSTLKGLNTEDRALFLWNWIGVDKMPAEGAKVMKLSISPAKGKFIVAHTCFKDLQIPKYETRQQMETAVLIVINNVKSGQAIIED